MENNTYMIPPFGDINGLLFEVSEEEVPEEWKPMERDNN